MKRMATMKQRNFHDQHVEIGRIRTRKRSCFSLEEFERNSRFFIVYVHSDIHAALLHMHYLHAHKMTACNPLPHAKPRGFIRDHV